MPWRSRVDGSAQQDWYSQSVSKWRYHSLALCHRYRHDDVIKINIKAPRYWPFVRGIHRSPVNSPHKAQWRGALMFILMCARINGWANNREAGDLRRYRAHYDVIVMSSLDHIIGIKYCSRTRVTGDFLKLQFQFNFISNAIERAFEYHDTLSCDLGAFQKCLRALKSERS